MRVLTVVHHRNAAAGVFADPAKAAGHELVEWLPHEQPAPPEGEYAAAMVFGGYAHVDQEETYPWLRREKAVLGELLEAGTPLLGVCLGAQLVAEAAGAQVRPAERPEIGWTQIELTPEGAADPVVGFLPERLTGFGWHHYEWLLPPGGVVLASNPCCLQAFRLEGRLVWGLQFHAEVMLADLESWLDGWENDPGAAASGLDPEAIRAESAERIGSWNELGRGIAARFLAAAEGELSRPERRPHGGRKSAPRASAPTSGSGNRAA